MLDRNNYQDVLLKEIYSPQVLVDYFRQYIQEHEVATEWAALMMLLLKAENEKNIAKVEKYYAELQKYPDNYLVEIIKAELELRFYGYIF